MSTDLVVPSGSFAERMAKYATQAMAVVAPEPTGLGFVGTRAGVLTIDGKPVPNNKLDCIVVDFVKEYHYYDRPFDAENPASPVCYAFGDVEKSMEPHPESEKPQAKSCSGCPRNKFPPKLPNGKQPPKECKNVYRLALIPSSPMTPEAIEAANPVFLRVPVMSGANWAAHVTLLSSKGLATFAALTQISSVPDPKAQFKLTFAPIGVVQDEATFRALEEKHEALFDVIQFPYRKNGESEAA